MKKKKKEKSSLASNLSHLLSLPAQLKCETEIETGFE